jgi:serine/threonine protein kinase
MKRGSDSIEYPLGQPMPGTKWVVHGTLGQGGMGIVLDVVKARLIRGAMKVLHPSFAKMPEFAERFLDEVKFTAQLQHPNIVQVLDFDRLDDGTPFMVMERLRGRTLRAALRETRQRGMAWAPANTYAVAAQMCEGLSRAHSHARAIVHRDVKPENIYLHRPEGSLESVVKVMDFGVAAVVGQRDRGQIGTPRYMAPEQLRGDGVSSQTDQYALALVVYEMLTGRLPWDVDVRDVSAMAKVHLSVPPSRASTFCSWVPEGIDDAILKALSKDPAARHESVHRLLFELRALQRIDRSSDNTTDAASTYPMVGTLADGDLAQPEEPDTEAKMSQSPPAGPVASVSDFTGGAGFDVPSSLASLEAYAPASPRAPTDQGQALDESPDTSGESSKEMTQLTADANQRDGAASAHESLEAAEIAVANESLVGSQSAPQGDSPSGPRLRRGRLVTLLAACGGVALMAVVTTNALRQRRADRAQPVANRIEAEEISNIDSRGTQVLGAGGGAQAQEPASELGPSLPPVVVRGSAESAADRLGEPGSGGAHPAASSSAAINQERGGDLKGTAIAPALPSPKIPTSVRPPTSNGSLRPASSTSPTPNPKARYDKF